MRIGEYPYIDLVGISLENVMSTAIGGVVRERRMIWKQWEAVPQRNAIVHRVGRINNKQSIESELRNNRQAAIKEWLFTLFERAM